MFLACSRSLFFMAFLAGAMALGASYYLEYAIGLKPCGLCLLQRLFLLLYTLVCMVAALHGPERKGCVIYWLSSLVCAIAGVATAWRQVLLQGDPVEQLLACWPGEQQDFANMPWLCVLKQLFDGNVDCAQVTWSLFDLSIPEWSLLFFVATMILGVYQTFRLTYCAFQAPSSGESSHQEMGAD
ncbi:disulfide bond formation protein DsbB [Pseudomonas sp. ok272]|uniref:disulfide bond formation protein B n=1 Tax=unclassified Pseudomonas TaxID=196821 RepID=UPI0008B02ABE|nr:MULTISPECIES: disulfide bond formation protein B [unclassified Pseudomonas]SEM58796.1 disulfide bond formation protein DsbB [Pseudomonas sp. ok272]SFM51693.1 disulfide bond formation protein DsbB [Pseudomonas sp. ok602]